MEVPAAKVVAFYRAINVASIKILEHLEVGNLIHIKGHTTDFNQVIESLQVNHQRVSAVFKDQIAGMYISDYARKNDFIYRIDQP